MKRWLSSSSGLGGVWPRRRRPARFKPRKVRTLSAETARPNSQPCASEQPKFFERAADLLGFDALGGDRHVQRVAEAGDGGDDRRGLLALDQGGDEALVDLDPVDRQRVDLGEAGIAGAEIVEADADRRRSSGCG